MGLVQTDRFLSGWDPIVSESLVVQTDRFLSGWDPIVSESLGQKSLEEFPIQNKHIG